MNNLHNNITNKNNFHNKLTTPTVLLIFLIYLLSVTLIPIANSIINSKNNFYIKYNTLSNKAIATKTYNAAVNTINTVTYINNKQMLSRQIDNNNLQNYINDAKGSVLKLNDSSNIKNNQTYSYDVYGKPITNLPKTSPALNIENSFMYNGERFDNNTSLQYLCARFYNPETKRFLNQDTYNLLNKFGYVNGNPVMATDPNGNDALDWIKNAWGKIKEGLKNTWSSDLGKSIITGIATSVVASVGSIYVARAFKKKLEIQLPILSGIFIGSLVTAGISAIISKNNDSTKRTANNTAVTAAFIGLGILAIAGLTGLYMGAKIGRHAIKNNINCCFNGLGYNQRSTANTFEVLKASVIGAIRGTIGAIEGLLRFRKVGLNCWGRAVTTMVENKTPFIIRNADNLFNELDRADMKQESALDDFLISMTRFGRQIFIYL